MEENTLDRIVADTDHILEILHPRFDMTDEERKTAREYAKKIQLMLSGCKGDKKGLLVAFGELDAMTFTIMKYTRGQIQKGGMTGGPPDDQTMSDWQMLETEQALDRYDDEFQPTWRREQIQFAVIGACRLLLMDKGTWIHRCTEKIVDVAHVLMKLFRGQTGKPHVISKDG